MLISVCSLPNFLGERGCLPRGGGGPGREPCAEEHPPGVGAGAAQEPLRPLAGHHCGHHHGLLPALWSQCGECPHPHGGTRGRSGMPWVSVWMAQGQGRMPRSQPQLCHLPQPCAIEQPHYRTPNILICNMGQKYSMHSVQCSSQHITP